MTQPFVIFVIRFVLIHKLWYFLEIACRHLVFNLEVSNWSLTLFSQQSISTKLSQYSFNTIYSILPKRERTLCWKQWFRPAVWNCLLSCLETTFFSLFEWILFKKSRRELSKATRAVSHSQMMEFNNSIIVQYGSQVFICPQLVAWTTSWSFTCKGLPTKSRNWPSWRRHLDLHPATRRQTIMS